MLCTGTFSCGGYKAGQMVGKAQTVDVNDLEMSEITVELIGSTCDVRSRAVPSLMFTAKSILAD